MNLHSDHLQQIERVEFASDTSDLSELNLGIDEAKIIGIGEAAHGVREFFTLGHRLVAHLVTHHDVRLFGLEAHFSEAVVINDYVVDGAGESVDVIDELNFWIWKTEAFRDLIEWMREFNRDRPPADRIKFFGIDMQSTKAPAAEISTFLQQTDPGFHEEIASDLAVARQGVQSINRTDEEAPPADETVQARIKTTTETVTKLYDRFEERRPTYVATAGERRYKTVKRHLRLLEQATELAQLDLDTGRGLEYGQRRDAFMAETVEWILDTESHEKIAIRAANGHLRKGNDHHDEQTEEGPLGYHLHQRFGNDYYALATEFGKGTVRVVNVDDEDGSVSFPDQQIDAPPADSFLGVLDDTVSSPAFLDLDALADDPRLAEWLSTGRGHGFAPVYDSDRGAGLWGEGSIDYSWELDGLCFVPGVTATRLLPSVTSRAAEN